MKYLLLALALLSATPALAWQNRGPGPGRGQFQNHNQNRFGRYDAPRFDMQLEQIRLQERQRLEQLRREEEKQRERDRILNQLQQSQEIECESTNERGEAYYAVGRHRQEAMDRANRLCWAQQSEFCVVRDCR